MEYTSGSQADRAGLQISDQMNIDRCINQAAYDLVGTSDIKMIGSEPSQKEDRMEIPIPIQPIQQPIIHHGITPRIASRGNIDINTGTRHCELPLS